MGPQLLFLAEDEKRAYVAAEPVKKTGSETTLKSLNWTHCCWPFSFCYWVLVGSGCRIPCWKNELVRRVSFICKFSLKSSSSSSTTCTNSWVKEWPGKLTSKDLAAWHRDLKLLKNNIFNPTGNVTLPKIDEWNNLKWFTGMLTDQNNVRI